MEGLALKIGIAVAMCGVAVWGQGLTVEGGYTAGGTATGETAHIWAAEPGAGQVFAGWEGDTQFLLDARAAHTTLRLPEGAVRVRATYARSSEWVAQLREFGGTVVHYHVPAGAAGVVFVFHGTGKNGAFVFQSTEFAAMLRDLVAGGFGVVAFDSVNRAGAFWDEETTGTANPDVVRLQRVIAEMRLAGVIEAQTPLLALGHSNGGSFAHLSAAVVNWAGVGLASIPGSAAGLNGYRGPVYWQIMANDDWPSVGQQGNRDARANYETVARRGGRAWMVTMEPQPLYAERFARVAGVSVADSRVVYEIFSRNKWLDAGGFLMRHPGTLGWQAELPVRLAAQQTEIQRQLEVSWAGHEFTADGSALLVDFFLRAAGRSRHVEAVSAASYTGGTRARGEIATVFAPGMSDRLLVAQAGPDAGLGNTLIMLRDETGTERLCAWFFQSAGQGSFLIPDSAGLGAGVMKLEAGARRWAFPVTVARASPGIFAANGDGRGAPAATMLRVGPGGERSNEFPIRYDSATGRFSARPVRFGSDRLFLDFYGTGLRYALAENVRVEVDGEMVTPTYAGAQPEFAGLDQVTIELPRRLAGRGRVEATVIADGVRANTVELLFVE